MIEQYLNLIVLLNIIYLDGSFLSLKQKVFTFHSNRRRHLTAFRFFFKTSVARSTPTTRSCSSATSTVPSFRSGASFKLYFFDYFYVGFERSIIKQLIDLMSSN